jgi:hypothetical protein
MSLEKTEELRVQFRLSSLHKEAQSLKSEGDWQRYTEIGERHEKLRSAERQDFKDRFDDRMSAARKKVIDEAGSKTLEHPTPIGANRFNPRLIDRKALARVQQDHHQTIAQIDKSEMQELENLMAQARQRSRSKEPVRERNRGKDRPAQKPSHQRQPPRS